MVLMAVVGPDARPATARPSPRPSGSRRRPATRPARDRRCRRRRRAARAPSRAAACGATGRSSPGSGGAAARRRRGAARRRAHEHACSSSSPGRAATSANAAPIVAVRTFSSASRALRVADVDDHDAAAASAGRAASSKNSSRREVERDVGLAVGVDEDRVVAAVGAAQERPRVAVCMCRFGPRRSNSRRPTSVSSPSISTASTRVCREEVPVGARDRPGGVAEDRDRARRARPSHANGSTSDSSQ